MRWKLISIESVWWIYTLQSGRRRRKRDDNFTIQRVSHWICEISIFPFFLTRMSENCRHHRHAQVNTYPTPVPKTLQNCSRRLRDAPDDNRDLHLQQCRAKTMRWQRVWIGSGRREELGREMKFNTLIINNFSDDKYRTVNGVGVWEFSISVMTLWCCLGVSRVIVVQVVGGASWDR